MIPELISDNLFAIVDKVLTFIISGVVAVIMFIVKSASAKVDGISDCLDDHNERITALEHTYVSKSDLEKILTELQRDLQGSFERAHSRIDELYSSGRNR